MEFFYKKKPLLKLNKPAKMNNEEFQEKKIRPTHVFVKFFETLSLPIN